MYVAGVISQSARQKRTDPSLCLFGPCVKMTTAYQSVMTKRRYVALPLVMACARFLLGCTLAQLSYFSEKIEI